MLVRIGSVGEISPAGLVATEAASPPSSYGGGGIWITRKTQKRVVLEGSSERQFGKWSILPLITCVMARQITELLASCLYVRSNLKCDAPIFMSSKLVYSNS